jgi:hypothetical protein
MLISDNFYRAYIKLPTQTTSVHESIVINDGLFPFFKHCLGTIDGIHIPAFVPEDKCAPFCNYKGMTSQNVLAACSFDFKFVYILSGWEGSAFDSTVYQDARQTDFQVSKGKYYLVDADYPNTDSLFAPYWGVQYHLKEWGNIRDRCNHS